MTIAVKLKVKYGLRNDPDVEQISTWSRDVLRRVQNGVDAEDAGREAAVEHFGGVDSCLYGSEADNIQALLKALAAR